MADLPSREDLRRTYEVALLNPPGGPRPRVTRAALETPGSDANAMREAAAAVGDEVVGALGFRSASWWISSAEDEELDKRVLDAVGIRRLDARVSVGSAQFRLTTPMAADLPIPKETLLSCPDGTQFLTTREAVFPKASVGPLSVPVRSKKAGAGVLAEAHSITSIVGTIPNAPVDLVVDNDLATSPGDASEGNADLRAAFRNYPLTSQKATLQAVEQAALRYQVDGSPSGGVVAATALEYYDTGGRQTKQVLLCIADKYTDQYIDQNVVPPTYQARSQALAGEVSAFLRGTRAAGIYVGVFVCRVIPLQVALNLTFRAGVDAFAVAEEARAVVVNFVNNLKPGAAFRRADVVRALQTVPGLYLTGSEVVSPLGDEVPRVLEKFGTDLRFVLANSSAVERPLPTLYSIDGYQLGG